MESSTEDELKKFCIGNGVKMLDPKKNKLIFSSIPNSQISSRKTILIPKVDSIPHPRIFTERDAMELLKKILSNCYQQKFLEKH